MDSFNLFMHAEARKDKSLELDALKEKLSTTNSVHWQSPLSKMVYYSSHS